MRITEIVNKYLKVNGFDGLYNFEDGCSCYIGEACGDMCDDCEPVYLHTIPDDCPKDCNSNCFEVKDYQEYFCVIPRKTDKSKLNYFKKIFTKKKLVRIVIKHILQYLKLLVKK